MNSLQLETKMTSRVLFSFMYRAESIKASGWGGSSLVAGLVATAMVVLSFDTAAASLLLKRRLARSPNFSIGAG